MRLLIGSHLRGRTRSWLAPILVAGIAGGAVIAAASGSDRTETAYGRLREATRPPDLAVNAIDPSVPLDAIGRLPTVAEATGIVHYDSEGTTDAGGRVSSHTNLRRSHLDPIAFEDARIFGDPHRIRVLEGRLPDPGRPDEAMAPLVASQQVGLHVGSTLHMHFAPFFSGPSGGPGQGAPYTVRVVGVALGSIPDDFSTLAGASSVPPSSLYLTPAFARSHPFDGGTNRALALRLWRGEADIEAFRSQMQRLPGTDNAFLIDFTKEVSVVQGSIHLQTVALELFALLSAVALIFVMGPLIARQTATTAGDAGVLRALGASSVQLRVAAAAPTAFAGIVSAGIALCVAIGLSPLTPIGLARTLEPTPGVAVNALILAIGGAGIAAAFLAIGAAAAWRAAREPRDAVARSVRQPSTTSSLTTTVAGRSLPVTLLTGIRMALTPARGGTRLPTMLAILGGVIAVASVAAAMTFRTSLDQMLATPRLYGWNWDAIVTVFYSPGTRPPQPPSSPAIASLSAGTFDDMSVDSKTTSALALDPALGPATPVVTSGRAPVAPNEILLGAKIAQGKSVGDTVNVVVHGHHQTMTMVGRGVLPASDENGHLDEGAFVTFPALRSLLGNQVTGPNVFPVVFRPGVNSDRFISEMEAMYGGGTVEIPVPPAGLASFGDIDQLPGVLAALLVSGAIAILVHTLIGAMRSRRRDLAILKTLGFTRGQVAAAVGFQAATLIAIAVVIGLPAGVAAGRWAWALFATTQGTTAEPVLPLAPLLLAAPVALLLAVLVALIPGRLAARTRPALVLRAE